MKCVVELLLVLILLSGCIGTGSTCKSPYIEYKKGDCCLDANENSICDREETTDTTIVTTTTSATSSTLPSSENGLYYCESLSSVPKIADYEGVNNIEYSPRDVCIYNLSLELRKPELCEKIPISFFKEYCNTKVYTHIATLQKNVSICHNMTDKLAIAGCYSRVAYSQRDLSVCDKIANLSDDASLVAYAQTYKAECYRNIAFNLTNILVCQEIQVGYIRDTCIEDISYHLKKPEYCNYISDKSTKERCQSNHKNNTFSEYL